MDEDYKADRIREIFSGELGWYIDLKEMQKEDGDETKEEEK